MNDKNEISRIRYETQHFGFPVESVMHGVKEMVQSEIEETVNSMKNSILKKNANDSLAIQSACSRLIDEFVAQSVKPFEMAEEQIKQCFSIPDHVLLPGDEIQRQQFTKEEEISLNNKLENLKARYQRAVMLEKILQEEKKVSNDLSRVEYEILKIQKSEGSEDKFSDQVDKLLSEYKSLNSFLESGIAQLSDLEK